MSISSSWSSYITPDRIPPRIINKHRQNKGKKNQNEITHTPETASNAVSPERKNSELQIKFMNAYSISKTLTPVIVAYIN